jgi:hypothetical protein
MRSVLSVWWVDMEVRRSCCILCCCRWYGSDLIGWIGGGGDRGSGTWFALQKVIMCENGFQNREVNCYLDE